MKQFNDAQWIWRESGEVDEYAEFLDSFYYRSGSVKVRISCDGDYTLFINGTPASFGQYGDFEHYKIYDTVDITDLVKEGKNTVAILVWHFGKDSQRYITAPAGLLYEVEGDGEILAKSGTDTLVRKSRAYQSGRCKKITGQLGFGFAYDATKEDGWVTGSADGFCAATVTDKICELFPRPIEKHTVQPITQGVAVRNEEGRILLDLGTECVGLLSLRFVSPCVQNITICFGEHTDAEGWVPRYIGRRDFSVQYVAKQGGNEYTNHMLRFGCRYLELQTEAPLQEICIGICNTTYAAKRRPYRFDNELDRRIYELCANTLEKCMMEHYVDCPWREQCLYAYDSRNQMLCGYRVFEDGNAAYARANLLLFSKDRRNDGLLSICSPCGSDLTIPSFSLYYVIAVNEYLRATGDVSLIGEVYGKLTELTDTFLAREKDGLIYTFEGKEHWNFYDWAEHCDGSLGFSEEEKPDALIQFITVLALRAMEEICRTSGYEFPYEGRAERLAEKGKQTFFRPETGLIALHETGEAYTELANAIALLAGIFCEEEAGAVCRAIAEGSLSACSLSMRPFKYDALLQCDRERYLPFILAEIRRDYKTMLDAGSDCAWETAEGASAFEDAGSLCHGWSAIPVLYLPQSE